MYKLLVVDDEDKLRTGLCTYFPWDEAGFEIVGQAENGRQALDFLKNHSADVLLCDVKMPVLSGLELAEELRKQKIRIKIVFFSGYRSFEFAQKALEYGVKNYIVKSAKFSELISVFRKIKEELDFELSAHSDEDNVIIEDSQENQGYYDRIINTIKTYVRENYTNVELEDVSKIVNMNPNYISRLFKKKSGQNFSDYLLEVKMEKAKCLLKDINIKIYEISSMLGYTNVKNFARAFRLFYGKSPREFRKGKSMGERL